MINKEKILKFTDYAPSIITVYDKDGYKLMKELSLLVINTKNNTVLAIGIEAESALENAKAINEDERLKHGFILEDFIKGSPFRYGAVADIYWASVMFRHCLIHIKAYSYFKFRQPNIAVCAPIDMTQVELNALVESVHLAGTKKVLIIEEPYEKVTYDIPSMYKYVIEITSNQMG